MSQVQILPPLLVKAQVRGLITDLGGQAFNVNVGKMLAAHVGVSRRIGTDDSGCRSTGPSLRYCCKGAQRPG
jgi:hypothetical protein